MKLIERREYVFVKDHSVIKTINALDFLLGQQLE